MLGAVTGKRCLWVPIGTVIHVLRLSAVQCLHVCWVTGGIALLPPAGCKADCSGRKRERSLWRLREKQQRQVCPRGPSREAGAGPEGRRVQSSGVSGRCQRLDRPFQCHFGTEFLSHLQREHGPQEGFSMQRGDPGALSGGPSLLGCDGG